MQIRKGYLATLTMVAFAMSASAVKAEAPVITDPGDYIVGDSEDGIGNNVFVFPDAFDLDGIVSDDTTADTAIKWSYSGGGRYLLNGVPRLEAQGGVSVANINNPGTELRATDGDNGGFNINPDLGGGTQDAAGNTLTIRNQILSPGTGATGPHGEPGTTGVQPSETETITLFASDCSTFSSVSITLYTSNDTSDALSGLMQNIFDLDFIGDPTLMSGWVSYTIGTGTPSSTLGTGLCMTTPGPNTPAAEVGWRSPHYSTAVGQPNLGQGGPGGIPGLVELVDMSAVRFRMSMWTDQATNGAVPFWTAGYYNLFFNAAGAPTGDVFAGDQYWWSVAGAANRIALNGSMANPGRVNFDLWAFPNPGETLAWRGLLPDLPGPTPNPDNDQSAFTTANNRDWRNDINFQIRAQDGNTNLAHQIDLGTICLTRLRADRIDVRKMNRTLRHGGPINTATHAIFPDVEGPNGGFPGTINNGAARAEFALASNNTTNPNGAGKNFQFYDAGGTTVDDRKNPFVGNWNDDEVLNLRIEMRSAVGGHDGSGTTEGTDPLDLIFLNWLTRTAETGFFNLAIKSFGSNMQRAASPRLPVTVGGVPQEYTSYMATASASVASTITNPDRLHAFINVNNSASASQSGPANGLDPFTIQTFEIWVVDQTGFLN
jgi:hypothetical protein